MGATYQVVQWNPYKRRYDIFLWIGILAYLGIFVGVGTVLRPAEEFITTEILLIRALGTCAFLMLHIVLAIGPLARLDKRFLPLLYNRRHFGVSLFIIALAHGVLATIWYHGFGELNPLVSLISTNDQYDDFRRFPYESLGLVALIILAVMAATSHDFWLHNLGPTFWKTLHMGVYLAYGLLVFHVALGVLQSESSLLYPLLLGVGVTVLTVLHVTAGRRENALDNAGISAKEQWVDICAVEDIEMNRAKIAAVKGGERVAIFRYDNKVSAVSNACAHQNGPLGEGKVIDGCITCPWHGYQYRPEDGQSPPPFEEKIPTYRVQVTDGRILLNPEPLAPGTPVDPAIVS